jgi:hypothetical protein
MSKVLVVPSLILEEPSSQLLDFRMSKVIREEILLSRICLNERLQFLLKVISPEKSGEECY